jgi:Spy/CpxP family protein refolding chaperone
MIPRNAGRAGLLLSAASNLELKDPEKTQKLDAIAKSFADDEGKQNEAKAIHDELVAQVKAGKIDTAKLEPLYVALEKAAKAHHEKEVVALDGIYAALGPLERKTMTDSLRKKLAAREAIAQSHKAATDGGAPKGPSLVDRMTKNLGLDEAQQKKAEAIVPSDELKKMEADREEEKKHLEALLVAFEKDGFDAKKVPTRDPKKVRAPFLEQAKVFEKLVPILKPEQREKLASGMEHARGGGGPMGPGGPGGGLGRRSMHPGQNGAHGWGDHEP